MNNRNLNLEDCNTVVMMNLGTLKDAFQQWLNEQEQARLEQNRDMMLDQAVVMERLRKSRATLFRWDRSGYLPCYKNGGRNQYKLSDVERIEKGLRL